MDLVEAVVAVVLVVLIKLQLLVRLLLITLLLSRRGLSSKSMLRALKMIDYSAQVARLECCLGS